MITFLVCLALLVGSYFTYGRYVERLFGARKGRDVPSKTHYDGVDYIPMTMIVSTYLFTGHEMIGMDYRTGVWLGGAVTLSITVMMLFLIKKYKKYDPATL